LGECYATPRREKNQIAPADRREAAIKHSYSRGRELLNSECRSARALEFFLDLNAAKRRDEFFKRFEYFDCFDREMLERSIARIRKAFKSENKSEMLPDVRLRV